MRAVVTRVKSASVSIDGAVHGAIGPGLLVLLGVHQDDTEAEEAFEEPEAPEIDVTAALVQEPEKPKARNTRKGGKGK